MGTARRKGPRAGGNGQGGGCGKLTGVRGKRRKGEGRKSPRPGVEEKLGAGGA